jgi:hypothetical protein
MRLDPLPKRTVRVHDLAKELGWPSSRLVAELRRRGEYVKSAMSTIEAPIVRAIRRDFASASAAVDPDESLEPNLYGKSADIAANEPDESFEEAVARLRSQPPRHHSTASTTGHWRSPVLQALLDEIVARRPERLAEPRDGHFRWELKKAEKLHIEWAAFRLNGLAGNDRDIIDWISLSKGEQPHLAAGLSSAGITPDEADLHLGYGGRIDPRMASLFERFRDGRINRSEVINAVRQWRENSAAS